ncbi:hypothetical protein RSK60_440072 [Ralstonia solanacearum K60]|nr:hypothetical protein RSK60_440072 [Ralstonia solanacearum K60]
MIGVLKALLHFLCPRIFNEQLTESEAWSRIA